MVLSFYCFIVSLFLFYNIYKLQAFQTFHVSILKNSTFYEHIKQQASARHERRRCNARIRKGVRKGIRKGARKGVRKHVRKSVCKGVSTSGRCVNRR